MAKKRDNMSNVNITLKVIPLTENQICAIKEFKNNGISLKETSKQLNLNYNTIQKYYYNMTRTYKTRVKNKKQRKEKQVNKINSYYRQKTNNWFNWKAGSLLSSFKQRHKKINKPLIFELNRKEFAEYIKTIINQSCYYCGTVLTKDNFTVDHKQALFRGGDTVISNLAFCCKKCNCSKGYMTEQEYKELILLISTWEDKGKSILGRLRAANKMYIH